MGVRRDGLGELAVLARVICLYGWPDHPASHLGLSGGGVSTTTTNEIRHGISATVGINPAKGWYTAGLDLCHCLLRGQVEPSKALWKDASPLNAALPARLARSQPRPYSRASAQNGGGGMGVFADVFIRNGGFRNFCWIFRLMVERFQG